MHRLLDRHSTYRRPIFVNHAEERFSWESEIAGVVIAKEKRIPLKWRGCSKGCLDYLDRDPNRTALSIAIEGSGDGFDDLGVMDVDSSSSYPAGTQRPNTGIKPPAVSFAGPFTSEGFEFDDDD